MTFRFGAAARYPGIAALTLAFALPALAGPESPAAGPAGETNGTVDSGTGWGRSDRVPDQKDWSIKKEVDKIETHMRGFTDLSESLGSAQKELAQDFEAYLADPKNERLASGIEKKMALFADQVVHDFDRVISDQDALISNFKELKRKLTRFDGNLGDRVVDYETKITGIREEAKGIEQNLIAMAVKVKEAQDPQSKKALENEFAKSYRRFRLKNRNIRGYEHNLANYKVLFKNLQMLTSLFGQLQDKFADLMQNLESEKQYLMDSIEMQLDSVKIKKIMNEGFFSGERAIKNVTEKLAQLYLRVDAFTQVHDRINSGLGRFAETTDTLQKLSATIDEIGNGGITSEVVPASGPGGPASIDDAVEYFYKQRGKLKD
jgi:hypothetical protein